MATVTGPIMLTVGVDIGQQRDPTAIAVLEAQTPYVERPWWPRDLAPSPPPVFQCRFLERLPLGTPYPDVARRVAEIQRNASHKAAQRVLERTGQYVSVHAVTYVDATGVGKPIVDLLQEHGADVTDCYFTHGDRRTEDGGRVTIGKAFLVARLQMLFQSGRMRLPEDHPEARPLKDELLDYEIRVDQNANDRYGAFKTGAHDDLVTALGLAAQIDPGQRGGFTAGEIITALAQEYTA